MASSVRIDSSNIRDLATDFSSVPARKHGKHYHRAITAEKKHPLGLTWAYGPDVAKPQGDMSFERGSRNQPPHLDLNRSADVIGPQLGQVADAMARDVPGR